MFVNARDYQQVSNYLADGLIHLAYIGPAGFVAAEKKNPGVKMLITELSWNKERTKKIDSYRSVVLALKKRGDINAPEDLRNKKFGFVNKESTSGFVIPNVLLKEKGIDYNSFFESVYFTGSHTRLTEALVAESIDAGATWDANWRTASKAHGEIFKAILTSPPIPNSGMAIHPSVPPEIREKILDAFVNVIPAVIEPLDSDGFVVRRDEFYDIIRKSEQENR